MLPAIGVGTTGRGPYTSRPPAPRRSVPERAHPRSRPAPVRACAPRCGRSAVWRARAGRCSREASRLLERVLGAQTGPGAHDETTKQSATSSRIATTWRNSTSAGICAAATGASRPQDVARTTSRQCEKHVTRRLTCEPTVPARRRFSLSPRRRASGRQNRRSRHRRSALPRTARAGQAPSRRRTPPVRCCARG